jgi:hypothetical protein
MRANDWDPIREKHCGQRPCAPHKQAGHMTAPTNAAATSKKFLPIRRRPHMTQSGHWIEPIVWAEIFYQIRAHT